jgi:hypothetical protein
MANPFEYQKPTPEQVEVIEAIRLKCADLFSFLDRLAWESPHQANSRHIDIAKQKLEEVSMWANKGVVFIGK